MYWKCPWDGETDHKVKSCDQSSKPSTPLHILSLALLLHWHYLQRPAAVRVTSLWSVRPPTPFMHPTPCIALVFCNPRNGFKRPEMHTRQPISISTHSALALPTFLTLLAEAFSRAGYFTVDCEAPNPRLYSFEGAICCWDVPPTYKVTRKPPPSTQLTNGAAAAAAAEVEMQTAGAAAGSPGWYTSEQQQQQQQQRRTGVGQGSPRGRRSPSPSRQQQQGAGSRLQQPLAAAAADGDSLTAALSTYGRPVRGTACVQSASFIVFEEWCGLDL